MINITFPDGSVRSYEQGITGLQVAESISPALARSVISCGVNGETVELNRPIMEDATIELYKWDDEQGKHTFWHTSAHLLAEALQELYPGIQFGFGPAVENGFFYDVLLPDGQMIKESDFPTIEAKMKELSSKKEPVVRREVPKAEALKESTDWKATGDKLAELQKQWREIGPVQKKYTNTIWKRFIGACDYFYEQRDKNTSSKKHEENANLAAKKEIIAKLKAFDAANLSDDDTQAIQQLIDEWNGIGFVPFKAKDKIAAEFKAVVDSFGGAVSTRRSRQSQRGGTARDTGSPRERLQRQYEQKKSEIQTYENNLGFMNASSKTGNGFVDAIKSKIETLKKEADELLAQIKSLDAEEIEN